MRDEIRRQVEYELMMRDKNGNYMLPAAIALLLFLAGGMSMLLVPAEAEGEDAALVGMFMALAWLPVMLYQSMFTRTTEKLKGISVFKKYRIIPVTRRQLLLGKTVLITRFVIRCTLAFWLLNWFIRLLSGRSLLCIGAYIPVLVMLTVYLIQILVLWMNALLKLGR